MLTLSRIISKPFGLWYDLELLVVTTSLGYDLEWLVVTQGSSLAEVFLEGNIVAKFTQGSVWDIRNIVALLKVTKRK